MFIDDVQDLPGDPTVLFLQRPDRRVDRIGDARAGRKPHRLQPLPRVRVEWRDVKPDARKDVCAENARAAAIPEQGHGLRRLLGPQLQMRSEEHTSELQSLMRISYAVFCLKKKKTKHKTI